MWWFIGSSYIPSVLRGAGPVQPPIEGSSGCSEWSLQKIAFDFSLAANAVPHNERALGILHMIYRKLPKIHPSHPPLFAHYFEAKVGREGGGCSNIHLYSSLRCYTCDNCSEFLEKQPTSSMNEYYGKSAAVVVLALEPLWSGAIPA